MGGSYLLLMCDDLYIMNTGQIDGSDQSFSCLPHPLDIKDTEALDRGQIISMPNAVMCILLKANLKDKK